MSIEWISVESGEPPKPGVIIIICNCHGNYIIGCHKPTTLGYHGFITTKGERVHEPVTHYAYIAIPEGA